MLAAGRRRRWWRYVFAFKPDLSCSQVGRSHPSLSCWKARPRECLKTNCLFCTLLPGCLSDALCLHSPRWSYVCQTTVVRQQDRLVWGEKADEAPFQRPLMAVVVFLKSDLWGSVTVGQLFRWNFISLRWKLQCASRGQWIRNMLWK